MLIRVPFRVPERVTARLPIGPSLQSPTRATASKTVGV